MTNTTDTQIEYWTKVKHKIHWDGRVTELFYDTDVCMVTFKSGITRKVEFKNLTII